MCGIVGAWSQAPVEQTRAVVTRMRDALVHRGPDSSGIWSDASAGLVLAHRRLSIIDLSEAGAQPMLSADERLVITYNGELYNASAIARELETGFGSKFRGHSDTEVLLEAVRCWGLEGALGRFVGMFAFALWDRATRKLHLVRDRVGKKPLYYAECRGAVLFGSELKALCVHPDFDRGLDRRALAGYLRYACVPGSATIYRNATRVAPGSIVTVDDEFRIERVRYWSVRSAFEAAQRAPLRGDFDEITDQVETSLKEAVACRMVSDVPIGAFLSGGIDSSAVVAMMQEVSPAPIRTFTIGFSELRYDESEAARAVARVLGTEHTELTLSPKDAIAVIPELPFAYDEPFADSSQIATLLVSRLARRHVTVALTGDGGDEAFIGYNRYLWAPRVWSMMRLARFGRLQLARVLQAIRPAQVDRVAIGLQQLGLPMGVPRLLGDKLAKVARVLPAADEEALFRILTSQWLNPVAMVRGADEEARPDYDDTPSASFVERMSLWDMEGYLVDDILVKIDRATMYVSLEARAPLLDHRLLELLWRVPVDYKLHGGVSKALLRRILYRRVPRVLVDRPKMGFGVPIDEWLRGPLREWASDLLSCDRLRSQNLLDPASVDAVWREHVLGIRNAQHELWPVLMLQAWLDAQGSSGLGALAA